MIWFEIWFPKISLKSKSKLLKISFCLWLVSKADAHLANLDINTQKIGEEFRNIFWLVQTFPDQEKVFLSIFQHDLFSKSRFRKGTFSTLKKVEYIGIGEVWDKKS